MDTPGATTVGPIAMATVAKIAADEKTVERALNKITKEVGRNEVKLANCAKTKARVVFQLETSKTETTQLPVEYEEKQAVEGGVFNGKIRAIDDDIRELIVGIDRYASPYDPERDSIVTAITRYGEEAKGRAIRARDYALNGLQEDYEKECDGNLEDIAEYTAQLKTVETDRTELEACNARLATQVAKLEPVLETLKAGKKVHPAVWEAVMEGVKPEKQALARTVLFPDSEAAPHPRTPQASPTKSVGSPTSRGRDLDSSPRFCRSLSRKKKAGKSRRGGSTPPKSKPSPFVGVTNPLADGIHQELLLRVADVGTHALPKEEFEAMKVGKVSLKNATVAVVATFFFWAVAASSAKQFGPTDDLSKVIAEDTKSACKLMRKHKAHCNPSIHKFWYSLNETHPVLVNALLGGPFDAEDNNKIFEHCTKGEGQAGKAILRCRCLLSAMVAMDKPERFGELFEMMNKKGRSV